jgi:hypothetical protein
LKLKRNGNLTSFKGFTDQVTNLHFFVGEDFGQSKVEVQEFGVQAFYFRGYLYLAIVFDALAETGHRSYHGVKVATLADSTQ